MILTASQSSKLDHFDKIIGPLNAQVCVNVHLSLDDSSLFCLHCYACRRTLHGIYADDVLAFRLNVLLHAVMTSSESRYTY